VLCRLLSILIFGSCAFAESDRCLTGNSAIKPLNQRLVNSGYRYVWANTNQTMFPADRYTAGWISFEEGYLCDSNPYLLPFQGKEREVTRYTNYAWPKEGYSLEVVLGQVCEVKRARLTGAKSVILKAFSDKAHRWLPIAKGKNELTVTGFRTAHFRIEYGGSVGELELWGKPLGEKGRVAIPNPLPPAPADKPFKGLAMKPASAPSTAPDPFVYPQPIEMQFSKELLQLPEKCPIVVAKNASEQIRQIGQTLAEHAGSLVFLDLEVTDKPPTGVAVWLGLATDGGKWSELAKRRKLGENEIKSEGYGVEVGPEGVMLVGRDLRGLYYATRTFLMLLQPRRRGAAVPHGYVRDFPRGEIRPAFAFGGWTGDFKEQQAIALATLKYSFLQGGDPARGLMKANYLRYFVNGQLFPGSKSGTEGDLLEAKPGVRKHSLDITRLSGCPSHPDYWMRTMAHFEKNIVGWEGDFVDIGLDEMLDNPFNICPRCRSRGLTTKENIFDAYMKAYRFLKKRNMGVYAFATGFRRYEPFDFFTQVPTDSVLGNYLRHKENTELKSHGYRVVGGSTKPVQVEKGSPLHSGVVWNWGSEDKAAMFGEGKIRSQVIIAEQNWSTEKPEWKSPVWHSRVNRALDFVTHIIDRIPLTVQGEKQEYFTANVAGKANRSLKDDVYADGKGWLDEGPGSDLRHLPTGPLKCRDVPLKITDKEKAAIIVAGPGNANGRFPDQVSDIPIGRKAAELYFLHTCGRKVWSSLGRRVLLVGFYRIRFEDGTFLTVPIHYGYHITEWTREFKYRPMEFEPAGAPLAGATVAWRGGTDDGNDVTLVMMPWRNPYPEKSITAVDVLSSAQSESGGNQLCLLGISGRVPTELDIRATKGMPLPPLRTYRPRPALPEGVEALDLVRRTPAPLPQSMGYKKEWITNDKWFSATIESVAGIPFTFEKSEMNRGAYSALDPDDDPWRIASRGKVNPCSITINFKRYIDLSAVEVKGILPRIRYPGFNPIDFEAKVFVRNGQDIKLGTVSGHDGQEGAERWVFEKPIKASGIEIFVSKGDGLSAIHLYAKKGAIPAARFKPTKMDKESLTIGDEAKKPDDFSDEDATDEFEGVD
jgi:hypothetical protein